ncbi:MAG: hypothetical protein WCI11_06470 [Candidatus Methylumidiphilus sp.]
MSRSDHLQGRTGFVIQSAPEEAITPEAEGNCVAARRGGEQPEANRQSLG